MQIDGIQKHRLNINGKLSFASMPSATQRAIKERLASKDPTMKDALSKGALPGIKIDGKMVTKENIKDFEIDKMKSPSKPKKESKKKFSKDELQAMSFKELKKVGEKLGTTDRSKSKLIKEILTLQ